MGRVGKQAESEILPADGGGQAQIANGSRKVEPHGGVDRRNLRDDGGGSMTLWSRVRSWVRAMLQRSRMESEMDVELRFHVEAFAEDLVRNDVPREEALRRARIEFGGIERAKEECREARGISFIDSLFQDLRFGLRMLRKNPGFTATAVLALALGIGVNTTAFTVFDAVALRPRAVKDPDRLVGVYRTAEREDRGAFSYADY